MTEGAAGEPPLDGEPPHYLVGRIHEVLAHDPRVSELTVRARVVGRKLFLTGHVMTDERRDAVSTVVKEVAPDLDLHNEVAVLHCPERTDEPEHLA